MNNNNRVLLVLLVGVLMVALDIAIVGPALIPIKRYFGVPERMLVGLISSYVMFNLIGTPILAKLSDLFGRRNIYIVSVILFALGSLVTILASKFTVVILGRAIQGFGSGGIFPIAAAVIGDTFPLHRRGQALGLIGGTFGIAFLIGPVLGGLLLLINWQSMFLINIPIALLMIGLAISYLPNKKIRQSSVFDFAGVIIISSFLFSLIYGLNHFDSTKPHSFFDLQVWPFLLAAAGLLWLFKWLEAHTFNPLIPLKLFVTKNGPVTFGLAFGAGIAGASFIFLSAYVLILFGITTSAASFAQIPMVLALAIGAPLSGILLDHKGAHYVISRGLLLLIFGCLLLSGPLQHWSVYFLAGSLTGLGMSGLMGAPLRYLALADSNQTTRAASQSVLMIFFNIGQLIGSTLIGAFLNGIGGEIQAYRDVYSLVALVLVGLLIVAQRIKR